MQHDEEYMALALRLAQSASGRTSPNPLVGAVIVKSGRLLSCGWHHQAGKPHAEVEALRQAGKEARGGELFVTLEPCSHYGKTPPCADVIIEAGIRRVVVAMVDPNPLVAGKGIEKLRRAGIEVMVGVLEAEARRLNEIFCKWITTKRPFVVGKVAMSLDGKLATASGESKWITGDKARLCGHRLRDNCDAILVGIGTALADNPLLTARVPDGKNPLRIVLDSHARLPLDSRLVQDKTAKTLVAVTAEAPFSKVEALEKEGVSVWQSKGKEIDIEALLNFLGEREICSVLVEGGSRVLGSFLTASLLDKLYLFLAPRLIGGDKALSAFGGSGIAHLASTPFLVDKTVQVLADGDILISGYLKGKE